MTVAELKAYITGMFAGNVSIAKISGGGGEMPNSKFVKYAFVVEEIYARTTGAKKASVRERVSADSFVRKAGVEDGS